MEENEWNRVKDVVTIWIKRHPIKNMAKLLALWLGLNNEYQVGK